MKEAYQGITLEKYITKIMNIVIYVYNFTSVSISGAVRRKLAAIKTQRITFRYKNTFLKCV